MPSRAETLAILESVISQLPMARSKKMFGEVGVYYDEKMVASLCDDHFFVKPTAGWDGAGSEMAPPYPGAKDHWVLEPKLWQEASQLEAILEATAAAVPAPKPKKRR